ncbi:MAG: hypothetical protein KZQ83_01875 [gamma proteobacterium symbiont of Taylorina sp.]|nr:hypothetical protein [gamma proteobacterium symbiont of Taylorina sp.]
MTDSYTTTAFNDEKMINYPAKMIVSLIFFTLFFLGSTVSVAAPGAQLVKDINPGSGGSQMYNISAGSGRLFFSANDEGVSSSRQIWTSDGTAAGTVKLTNFDSTEYGIQYSSKNYLVVNNIYYFYLRRLSDNIYELWRSDGTVAGTFKLIDLPGYLDDRFKTVGAGGLFYFVPFTDKEYGPELWVSDGSVSGTRMVKDINPGTGGSSPNNLMEVNDKLYFLVSNDLWSSDGTSAGTKLLANFKEHYTRDMRYISNVNGMIYLAYLSGESGGTYELWQHNSSSGQTVILKRFDGIASDGQNYTAVGDTFYFSAKGVGSNSKVYDLWKSDGSADGTVLVKAFDYYTGPDNLTNVDGTLFFTARDEAHGTELWKSNGTANGTLMVKDINGTSYSSTLNCFSPVSDRLFFIHKKTNYVKELWMSDGTETATFNTDIGADNLRCPVKFNGQLYFYGNDAATKDYGSELYRYNLSANAAVVPEIMVSSSGTKLNMSWNTVPDSSSYILTFAPYPFKGPETIGSVDLGNRTSLSLELWSGAAFYLILQANHSGILSDYSNIELFIIK